MSLSYSECVKKVGLNRDLPLPELVYRWVGYSGGKIIVCKSMTEASQYTLHDRLATPESIHAREDFLKSNIEKESRAIEMFQKSLREGYPELSDELYDVCYREARARGHSTGLDEVANIMSDVVSFAELVQKATKT